jgi:HK97 family phage portal protein
VGILTNRLGIRALSLEDPAQPLLPPSVLFESLGLGRSDAGVLVNEKQAMRLTTVYACVKIISEDLASTGHEILQQFSDGSVHTVPGHRLWPLIHDQPNQNMTAKVFWGAMLACELLWGNGYAWIKRDGANRVIELVPLAPGKTASFKNRAGQLMYGTTQTDSGQVAYLKPSEVLHFKDVTMDGITGLSPIAACKNAIGLGLAAEKFGAQFFGNGARATGVFTHPGELGTEAYENLKKSFREIATGDQALRPLILEEGLDWKQITIPPNDAQFLATRQFQRVEIAALFRVAMHLLQDLQRATNNNIEHQSLDHVRYCLRPRAVGIEQEVNAKLLGGPFSMEHNLKDIQRGDFASQTAGIQTLRNIGYYSINDIARELRQNPIPAEEGGDLRIVQGAFVNITALLGQTEKPGNDETIASGAPDQTLPSDRMVPAFQNQFRDIAGRLKRASARTGHDPAFAQKLIEPVVTTMAQALVALRYGDCGLTDREKQSVAEISEKLAETPLADRAAVEAYAALVKEIP